MNILQINKFYYVKGGSEVYMFSLSKELQKRGHIVVPFSMKHKANQTTSWDSYFVNNIDYDNNSIFDKLKYSAGIIYSYESKIKLVGLLNKFKPDIAHLHLFQHQLSASILPVLKKNRVPIIYTAHDLKSVCPNYKMYTNKGICERCKGHKYYNCIINRCTKNSYLKSTVNTIEMYFHHLMKYYNLIDLIITPSRFYQKKMIEFGFPKAKIVYIPNFVNVDEFSPTYGYDNYFLYFGRLSDEKGLETLIKAMHYVKKVRCIIVGTGPLESKLKTLALNYNVSNVDFLGFKSGKELLDLISNSMFTILPSEWYENGPLSILESFACGKPVLGSNIAGIPEYISEGLSGLVFKPGDPIDCADKINKLAFNPKQTAIMGMNARKIAEKHYSTDSHINSIIDQYNRVIYKHRASAF